MHKETEKRVELLRGRIATGKKELDEAKVRFGSNSDEFLRGRIRQAEFFLGDLETIFIAPLFKEGSIPKSLAEESQALQVAEHDFANITMPMIKQIYEWSKTYGENFHSIGW